MTINFKKMSEQTTESTEADEDNVCRDFLRNVCRRGERCKYVHPESREKNEKDQLQDRMMFCHDFQNNRCARNNCKFIHCDRETEEEYKRSGYLPPGIRDQVIRKGVAVDFPAVNGGVPICKDFLKGRCGRDNCKYRHISPMEYDMEMNQYQGRGGRGSSGGFGFFDEEEMMYERRKRRYMEGPARFEQPPDPSNLGAPPPQAFQMIQDENSQLRLRCDELEKRVSDLTATNEFLLDQNAQLRMGVKTPVTGAPMTRGVSGPPQQPPMVGYNMHL